MKRIYSIEEMYENFINDGYKKDAIPHGVRYRMPDYMGNSHIDILGDFGCCYYMDVDTYYNEEYIAMTSIAEQYIEISYSMPTDVAYYQKKAELNTVDKGLNCFVNAPAKTGFVRIPAKTSVSYFGIVLRETFFEKNHIGLPDYFFEQAAEVLNPEVVCFPQIFAILMQIKNGRRLFNGTAYDVYLKAKILETAAEMIRYVEKANSKKYVSLSYDDKKAFDSVKEILENEMKSPPGIAELSKQVNVNTRKLKEGFKQYTGSTVFEYLRQLRMNRALELLESDDAPITSIAKEVGYSSPIHFYESFKKAFGSTPKEMRNRLK